MDCAARATRRAGRRMERGSRFARTGRITRSSQCSNWRRRRLLISHRRQIEMPVRHGRQTANRWHSFASRVWIFKRPLIPEYPRPWALWIADAQSGEGRELFRGGKAMKDSLPLFAFQSLQFTDSGRIIFASEKDGRNHLYSISTDGGAPQLLTRGDF